MENEEDEGEVVKKRKTEQQGRYPIRGKHLQWVNSKGILVTCSTTQEFQCRNEVQNLIDKFFPMFYPGIYGKSEENGNEKREEKEEEEKEKEKESFFDIEAEISKEVNSLKQNADIAGGNGKGKRKKKGSVYGGFRNSGVNGILFYKFNHTDIDPLDFVRKLFQHIEENPNKNVFGKRIARITPLQMTCPALEDSVRKYFEEYLAPFFNKEIPKTFMLVVRSRNNFDLSQSKITPLIASLIGYPHVVDFKSPDIYIVVEVFKHGCGATILDDFSFFSKFNMREFTKKALLKYESQEVQQSDS